MHQEENLNIVNNLFSKAVQHHVEHDCSAPPYENGVKLVEYLQKYNPTHILEIGTGMGYTAVLLAKFSPEAKVETLEKNPEHVEVAKSFCTENMVGDRVDVIEAQAEDFFTTTSKKYDFIFFDGFQVHYQFLPEYERLLKPKGILFLANNHLKSRTSDKFFEELYSSEKWVVLEKFADTTVAQRLDKNA